MKASDMKRTRVGIIVFPDVDVLDFCGPYEVFATARLDEAKRREEPSPFDVVLVAERREPVTTAAGMRVIPDFTFDDCPPFDVRVVPGGWGTRREIKNQRLLQWVATRAAQVQLLTSVCTGAMLLGQAGLLDGRHATTQRPLRDWMAQALPC